MPKLPIKRGMRTTISAFIRRPEKPKKWRVDTPIVFGKSALHGHPKNAKSVVMEAVPFPDSEGEEDAVSVEEEERQEE